MSRNYKHLTESERDRIYLLIIQKYKQKEIASALNRSPSTISRELKRNKSENQFGYSGHYAHKCYICRKRFAKSIKLNSNSILFQYFEEKIKSFWSPEQISGRLPIDKPGFSISHETIYKYIYDERRDFIPYLAQSRKQRKKRTDTRKLRKTLIPNRISIDKRPEYIQKREQIGHWESDSIISRQNKWCLHVLVERKTRLTLIKKIYGNTSANIKESIVSQLKELPFSLRRTITYDNGSENSSHEYINNTIGTKSYFCNPYHSWEKGTIENTNGLIRRFFPKSSSFKGIWNKTLEEVEMLLNNRPRKCLGFLTPAEVFQRNF
jgi:IS30 family transposase